jgi:hypothetical protein
MIATPGIVADERDPLLPAAPSGRSISPLSQRTSSEDTTVKTVTPLPLQQLSILGLVRLAEPINFTVIFPFVNQVSSYPSRYCVGLLIIFQHR